MNRLREVPRGNGGRIHAARRQAAARRKPVKERATNQGIRRNLRWWALSAVRSRVARSGMGSGRQARRAPCGLPEARAWSSRATEAAPSATAWWILATAARRLPASPSTTVTSHSGRSRGSARPAISATRAASSRSPPGGSTVRLCMCRDRSKSGSSIHIGWPSASGTNTTRCRNGGRRSRRCSRWATISSKEIPPGTSPTSNTATFSVCMCAVGVSE